MSYSKIAILGHSQIVAMERAHVMHRDVFQKEITFRNLHDDKYKPNFHKKNEELNNNIASEITTLKSQGFCFALSVGGGRHNVFGLVQHPVDFQVVSDKHDAQKVINDIITHDVIKNLLRKELEGHLKTIKLISEAIGSTYYFIEPPPPVPDDSFLLNVNSRFKESLNENGVIEKYTRYAIWNAQSNILKTIVNDTGGHYLETPEEMLDNEGFLSQKAWKDPTHGNEFLGKAFLNKLIEVSK